MSDVGRASEPITGIDLTLSGFGPVGIAQGEPGPLSRREFEAVLCKAEGLKTDEIALVMGCSIRTVKCHVEHAMNKLGARNGFHLVSLAYQRGIIQVAGFIRLPVLLMNLVLGILLTVLVTFTEDDRLRPARPMRQLQSARIQRGKS